MSKKIKQKKQDLGIFYTDPKIVDFIFGILKIWKDKEEKESGRWESRKHFPSVIDPACGEGIFLKKAISSKFTEIPYIFGADIDIEAFNNWSKTSLKSEFKNDTDKMRNFFFHQDGLSVLKPPNHKYHYRGIKKDDLNQFDTVVGNPPYGGIGIKHIEMISELFWEKKKNNLKTKKQIIENLFGEKKEIEVIQKAEEVSIPQIDRKRTEELKRLCQNLLHLEVWQNKIKKASGKELVNYSKKINGVDFYISEVPNLDYVKKLRNFPIEILFINRFIQLAHPGGWIAIIIPDGILTNSNSHYVREFISEKAKVEAIVSLPRDAFKNVGTTAKTSILFLQKYKDQEKEQKDYPVFLASVDSLDEKNFNFIKNTYQKYYNKNMSKKNLVQTTTDEKGREIVMVRVDKTLKEMMKEKPASRWDPAYWRPEYDEVISGEPLDNFIPSGPEGITYGAIITGKKNKHIPNGVPVMGAEQIKFTGIDLLECERTKADSPWDPERSRVHPNDLVFVRSGVGSLGKSTVYLGGKYINVGCFVDRIKLKGLSPFYTDVYLKTKEGRLQIKRLNAGVTGTTNISFDQIKSIKIPILPDGVQKNIESEYKKMSKYHDKAIEEKKEGNEVEYEKNIEIAEKMLKDLIAKTEAVIRGERKDVI